VPHVIQVIKIEKTELDEEALQKKIEEALRKYLAEMSFLERIRFIIFGIE